jgi:hypothetical protein
MQSDSLVQLIRSLTKAEKKAFRLHINKVSNGNEKMYVMLFDFIESTSQPFKVDALLRKYPSIKKSQVANLRSHLWKELLSIIRHLHRDEHADVRVREYIDYARILQDKGLISLSIDILDKATQLAQTLDDTMLLYLINAEMRRLETIYITGSSTDKAMKLNETSKKLMSKVGLLDRLSNLSLMLYGMYLKYGYIKDKRDYDFIKDFFESHLPLVDVESLGFYERIYYYQCHVWYRHMTLDFAMYYRYSLRWVECFNDQNNMKKNDVILYLKALHNTLNALYMSNKLQRFEQLYQQYILYGDNEFENMNTNEQSHYILFQQIHLLNGIFLSADYVSALPRIEPLITLLENNTYNWDINRIIIINYKMACVFFGNDNHKKCLEYLNKITDHPMADLRVDIQCFARILTLICHFELKNDYLLPYQIRSVYRYLYKMNQTQYVIKQILNFIRRIPTMKEKNLKNEFNSLRDRLVIAQSDKYQRQPFLYLDIIAWLDSKIHNMPIASIIKSKNS